MGINLAMAAALLANCQWASVPLPPVLFLPAPAYEMAARWPVQTFGFAEWDWGADGKPTNCRVTMREGASAREVCHELRHCVEGHWHPLTLEREPG